MLCFKINWECLLIQCFTACRESATGENTNPQIEFWIDCTSYTLKAGKHKLLEIDRFVKRNSITCNFQSFTSWKVASSHCWNAFKVTRSQSPITNSRQRKTSSRCTSNQRLVCAKTCVRKSSLNISWEQLLMQDNTTKVHLIMETVMHDGLNLWGEKPREAGYSWKNWLHKEPVSHS